jgi:two-component system, NtrC family, response regulator AtoC
MTSIKHGNEQQMRELLADGLHGEGWKIIASSPARRMAAFYSDVELVGRSQAFMEAMKQVGRASSSNLPVLITGEAGTGKQLVASAIHHRGVSADQPFVTVNCGAVSSESIEFELFGYMKGAFAGTEGDRRGLWDEAGGGTIFLDEITHTTPSVQARLLQELQAGEVRRPAPNQTPKANVRVIAASSRDVDKEVGAGRFRSDLFSRLSAISIVLPPLRQRPEDVAPLTQSFAARVYSLNPTVKLAPEALALLERYSWPGNSRELESVVVRAVALCDGTIRAKDLPERVRNYSQNQAEHGASQNGAIEGSVEEWVPLSEIEGRYVEQVLEHTRGNKQAAARVLAVDRKTLDRMIKRHHIASEKTRRPSR